MADRPRYEIGVGLLVLGAAGLLGWMSMKTGAVRQLGEHVEVVAIFDDAAGLKPGAAISVAGVDVGQVMGLKVAHDQAKVSLLIRADAQIREDVRVRIRARSVLGEKYVELLPQSREAPLLQSGEVLTDTQGLLEIDQFVDGLGPLLKVVEPQKVQKLVDVVLDAAEQDPDRAKRMLDDVEVLLHNARLASEEAPDLVAELRGTLRDVRAVTRQGSGLVDQTGAVLVRADAVLGDVEVLSDQLPGVAERLPKLLDEVHATVADTHEVVLVLSGNSERIENILANVEQIDKWELRRLLREEGIKVRLMTSEVVEEP